MNQLLKLLASNRRQATPRALETNGSETTLYIYDAIVADDLTADWCGGVSAQSLVPQIRAILGGTLHLRINSPGGDVFAAQAIVAAIKQTGARVVAHIDGVAASAATVISCAADEIEIGDGAMYMIHCGSMICWGGAADMLAASALLEKVDGVIADQYAAKTGKPAEDMKALMDAETWFTAQEAVDIGLADRIAATADKPAALWDLSAYPKAPAAVRKPPPLPIKSTEPVSATQDHRDRQQQRLRLLARNTHQ
ncbi:MAG: Clp protease ClpP [Polaromonas sp.]|nr:Clp protease ClpP [Polaromonas sp.]